MFSQPVGERLLLGAHQRQSAVLVVGLLLFIVYLMTGLE